MTTLAGNQPAATGNSGLHHCGADPVAAKRLLTSDRCSISSSATCLSERRHPSIAASSSAVTPSPTSRFRLHIA